MMMVELTSVDNSVLPVTELTDHLKLASGFPDDGSQNAQLESCLRAALSAIEARIGKALFRRRFALQMHSWQSSEEHKLPIAPAVSVETVKVISRAGVETSLDPASYRLRQDTHSPAIEAVGSGLPRPSQGGSVEVEFTAGFGDLWQDIPADLKQAVLIQAVDFYTATPGSENGMPFAVTVLIEPYRSLRLRGGAT